MAQGDVGTGGRFGSWDPDKDKLTLDEAADEFGVTAERIRNWYRSGAINRYTRPADGKVFVSRAEIRDALTPVLDMRGVPDDDGE